MAFEANCGVSTVLEEIRVTSTPRFPAPAKCLAPSKSSVGARTSGIPGTNQAPRNRSAAVEGALTGGAWHPDMTLSSTSCRRAWHPLAVAPPRSTGTETGTETATRWRRCVTTPAFVTAQPIGRSGKSVT